MSLTTGRGPLSARPAGRFSAAVPSPVSYIEPFQRRVRGRTGGRTVVDSERVLLVHAPGQPPAYLFPAEDVHLPTGDDDGTTGDGTTGDGDSGDGAGEAAVPGHVRVPWDAVEEWYEEEERVLGHPRNPYHRVDCLRSTRRLRVRIAGTVVVDTADTMALYETALAPRLYVRRELVDLSLLRPSATTSYCSYKGTASYWSAVVGGVTIEDVAWSYEDPLPESTPIAGLLAFDDNRVDVEHDLPAPTTALHPPTD